MNELFVVSFQHGFMKYIIMPSYLDFISNGGMKM